MPLPRELKAHSEPFTKMKPFGDWVSGTVIHYQVCLAILQTLATTLFRAKKHLIADLRNAPSPSPEAGRSTTRR